MTTALAVTPLLVAASVATANAAPTAHPNHSAPAASHPTPKIATAVRRQVAKHGTADVVVALRGNAATAHPDTKSGKRAHTKAIASSQSPVLSLLHSSDRATHVHAYNTFDAVSARVTRSGLAKLAASPDVAVVAPNATIKLTPNTVAPETAAKPAAAGSVTPPGGVCSTTTPQLNPEGLQTTRTQSDDPDAKTARSLGATGAGVTVAFMAEGLDVNNPDFIRPDGSPVFTDYQDFTGDGTSAPTAGGEAFLDASSIAAQGRKTYNVAHYSALSTKGACKIRIEGIAPDVNLVGLKVFGENSLATTSNFLQAIDYAVNTDHVNVLSESFGSNPVPDTTTDVIRAADEAAVAAGTTVTVSSGDAGITNTLGSPATSPGVISTGATTNFRSYLQSSYAFSNAPGVKGYLSDNISSLSSGGTDQSGGTVDLVAPGDLNWALCTADLQQYFDCSSLTGAPAKVTDSGGTSEAAPLTAGGAALVIQAYRQTHNDQNPSPALVKQLLVSTARDIGAPGDQQGAGELDTYRAVLAARSINGSSVTPTGQGNTFVTDTPQVDVTGAPGTAVTKDISVTNTGTKAQTITPSARTLANYTPFTQRIFTMSKSDSRLVDYLGYNDFYHKVTFRVPAGTDRLDAAIAFKSNAVQGPGRLALVGPNGRYAGYTLPQGSGNYGDTQVAHPTAGIWTAYIFTRPKFAGGTFGRYVFGFRTAKFVGHGTVSDAVTLQPGQSGTVTYTTTTPVAPGDRTTSIVLASSTGGSTTIPVVLRSLVPVSTDGTPFTGTLTGGNGREAETGQTEYYSFDVASGTPELNAQVSLARNPNNPFYLSLIDPNGDQVGYGSNILLPSPSGDPTPELSGVSHVMNPQAGRWSLVVNFAGFVSGSTLAQRFSVLVDTAQNTPTSTGLPTGTGTTLPAGQTYTAYVSVQNTTSAPEAYFADARTAQNTTYTLTGSNAALTLPLSAAPLWLVPNETSSVSGSFTSTKAAEFDLAPAAGAFTVSGDPDVESNSGTSTTAVYSAPSVTPGLWSLSPQLLGPFGATAAQHATGTANMTATTKTFDRTITSSTHDLWLSSVDENASTVKPVVVQPGKTGVITVHIKPTGTAGSTASGTLYIDDLASFSPDGASPNGNEVAALPYSYKIG